MNTKRRILGAAAVLAAMLALPVAAQEYVLHGRVSYDAGGGLIKGAEDSDYSAAKVNTLVLPGDTLWADDGTTTELEFSGGAFLRMADGSKAEIVSLPPSGVIRGWVGSFYVQRLKRGTGDVLFETPAARLDIDQDTSLRVDILSNGASTVTVRWGSARLFTDAGDSVYLRSGQRVWVDPGLLPSEPASFNRAEEDAFDAWNRERAEFLATGGPSVQQTPVKYSSSTIGYSDLDRYGEWVYVDSRPYWRPTVVVDYVPYRYGYWSHHRRIGNVWVGNYPFCYTTSHYGRWNHHARYGWIWSYDPVWSPAWVTTVRYGDYLLWSPVDYYHRPVLYGGHHASYFNIGGVQFGFFASSCVPYNTFYSGYGHHGIGYASPFDNHYYNNNRGNVQINIWNINIGDRNHVRTPFESVFTQRNYNPQRSIRGPLSVGNSNTLAVDRVRSLESRTGRASFAAVERTGSRGSRTAVSPSSRSAQTRVARVTQNTPSYTRATRSNPERAEEAFARTTGVRSGTTRTLTNSDADRAGRETPVARVPRTSSGGTSASRASTVSVEPPARTSSPRSISTRTPSRSDDSRRSVVSTGRTEPRTTSTPSSRTIQATPSTRTTTASPRSTSTRTSTPSVTSPGTTSSGRSISTSRSTPTRTIAPSRSSSSSPRVLSTPGATAPRVTSTAPRSTVQRQAIPSTRSTAPQRSVGSSPAPSRSYTPPTRSVSPAPSRSISTPSPRVSAPSRSVNSAPSVQRSAPSRSFSASPSRSSGSSSRSIGSSSSSSVRAPVSSGRSGSVSRSSGVRGGR